MINKSFLAQERYIDTGIKLMEIFKCQFYYCLIKRKKHRIKGMAEASEQIVMIIIITVAILYSIHLPVVTDG